VTQSLGVLEFGPYSPDNPDLYNPGLEGAVNVIPRQNHFEPLASMELLSSPIATNPGPITSALPSRALGAYGLRDSTFNSYVFAGVAGGLYQFRSGEWFDVSNAGGVVTVADRWEFAKWANTCIAVSIENDLQTINLGADNFTQLVSGIGAYHIAVVRDFVMLGNVRDTDGNTPNRIRWCAFRDPTDWTPSASTQADFRDLEGQSTDGKINRVIGGEYAIIFLGDSIWRATYEGPPRIFQLDEIDPDVGTISEGSIVQHAGAVYFLSEDGFRVTRGGISQSIGHQKINRDVLARIDYSNLNRIRAAVDKKNQIIVWALPGPGNTGGLPNTLVIYNFVHDKWAAGLVEVDYVFEGPAPYTSFDDPVVDNVFGNLDGVPGSADDPIWAGGSSQFLGIDGNFQLNAWTGPPYEAIFTTGERQFVPGKRASVNELRPLVDLGPNVSVEMGYRNRQSDSVIWTTGRSENAHGVIPFTLDARFIRVRATVPASTLFEDTVGVEVFGAPSGG